MERLTVKYINTLRTGVSVLSAINKLTDYENKEEKGLLLKLPCNIGDTVYAYCDEFGILTYTVNYIIIDEHKHITYQCSAYSEPIGDCQSECLDEIKPDIADFGKTVFLTREQAELILGKQLN